MMRLRLRSKEHTPSTRKATDMPPIHEIFGTLESVEIDASDNTGYIVLSYNKNNRPALWNIARELKEWEGRDVYIQVRLMTKGQG